MIGEADIVAWIDCFNVIRRDHEQLRRGRWHAYLEDGRDTGPMRGRYILVRWETPTIAISGNSRDDLVGQACMIEDTLTPGAGPRATTEQGAPPQ